MTRPGELIEGLVAASQGQPGPSPEARARVLRGVELALDGSGGGGGGEEGQQASASKGSGARVRPKKSVSKTLICLSLLGPALLGLLAIQAYTDQSERPMADLPVQVGYPEDFQPGGLGWELLVVKPWTDAAPVSAEKSEQVDAGASDGHRSRGRESLEAGSSPRAGVEPTRLGDTRRIEVPSMSKARTPALERDEPIDELTLIEAMSRAFLADDLDRVLVLVRSHEREFPDGTFVEERMAVHARAMCRLGRVEQGKRLAVQLEMRWPESSQVGAVRQDCSTGTNKDSVDGGDE